MSDFQNDHCQTDDWGRERGLGGGWLKVEVPRKSPKAVPTDFAFNASPQPISLVTFLFGDKKVTLAYLTKRYKFL